MFPDGHLEKFGGLDSLVHKEIPDPEPKVGHVVIEIKAFGINAGTRVIATTRNQKRFAMLEELGAARIELEGPDLSKRIAEAKQLDAVLDLVGSSTILDSLAMLRRGGRACLAS